MGHERHHHRLVDVRGGRLGDVVGGLEGGSQLRHGGGWLAQGGHHEQEVVCAALASDGGTSHDLGGHFGGALDAGAAPGVLAAEQGQETPVKLSGGEMHGIK